MGTSIWSGLAASWRPVNWVDWLIAISALTGLLSGARRGFILALGAVAAAVLAIVLAVRLGPAAAAAADAHWHTASQVSSFLQRYMPLPDGSGQIPYSPSAMQLYLHQATAQGGASAGYASALAALVSQTGPAQGSPTLGAYVDNALASRIVDFAAFGAVMIASEAVLLSVVRVLLGGVARRGLAGFVNAVLGAGLGLIERLVEVCAVLAMLASLSVLPALGGFAGALTHSRWAPILLGGLRSALPATDSAIRSWLLWI